MVVPPRDEDVSTQEKKKKRKRRNEPKAARVGPQPAAAADGWPLLLLFFLLLDLCRWTLALWSVIRGSIKRVIVANRKVVDYWTSLSSLLSPSLIDCRTCSEKLNALYIYLLHAAYSYPNLFWLMLRLQDRWNTAHTNVRNCSINCLRLALLVTGYCSVMCYTIVRRMRASGNKLLANSRLVFLFQRYNLIA